MPVYHAHQLVHIHIPKTAGTAIEEFFHRIGDMQWGPQSWVGQERRAGRWYEFQHLSYRELKSFTGSQYDTFRSLAVVRNPYLRLLSDYFWHQAPPQPAFESLDAFLRSIPRDMDARWEEHIARADQAAANVLIHVRPQYQYVDDVDGSCLVDEILRFETLDRDMARFMKRYDLDSAFIRPRPVRRIEDYLDRAQLDLINEIYAVDFERFSYAME